MLISINKRVITEFRRRLILRKHMNLVTLNDYLILDVLERLKYTFLVA